MSDGAAQDFFGRARKVAAAGIAVAGAAAVAGTFLDWVTFTLVEPAGTSVALRQTASPPISGFDVGRDAGWVVAAGTVMVVAAVALVLRRRALYAGIALVASMIVGAIAISDYRGVGDLTSDLARRLDLVGRPDPAVGLTLVAAAAVLGVIASVAGVAATPRVDRG